MAMRGAAARLLVAACVVALSGGVAADAAEQAVPTCESAGECVSGAGAESELSSLLQQNRAASRLAEVSKVATTGGITEIQEDYIVINGRGYSRYNANTALLGRYGPEFSMTAYIPPRLTFTENPEDSWLGENVQLGTSVWIQSSQQSSFNIDFESNAIPAVDIEASLNFNHSHFGEFYLMQMGFASQFELIQLMNDDSFKAKRAYIKASMDRPRIVTSVWILIEGEEESSSFCAGGSLSLKFDKIGAITVSGNGCKMSTWQFSPNSVMAYETSAIKFTKLGLVDTLVPDQATR